jgi:hypothetical protein
MYNYKHDKKLLKRSGACRLFYLRKKSEGRRGSMT